MFTKDVNNDAEVDTSRGGGRILWRTDDAFAANVKSQQVGISTL